MNARAFFFFILIFSTAISANDSDNLRLSGRVFPEVEINLAPVSVSSENGQSSYRIRSNMGLRSYRVFFEKPSKKVKSRLRPKFRHLVVEAK